MISRGGPPGPRRRGSAALLMLLLAASVWLYGALLVLYPKAFRHRYSEEMRRDFRELMLEGLQEGGTTEMVRVWAQASSDLVLTALKERGTSSARRYASYLYVDPRIAARAAARAMVAVALVAVGVSWASFLQTPTYEASAQVRVDQKKSDRQTYVTESGEEIQTFIPTMTHDAIDSHPVAEETIRRLNLDMTSAELLDNLTIEQVENTSFIVLTYEDTDPARATYIANTVGEVSSELISDGVQISVWEKASLPTTPVSPHPLRNGLLTLVIGLVLCVGVVLALPGVAASVAGKLGRPIVLQGASQAAVLGEALDRRGKLTAVEAALESSLSVEEAERMLEALAAKGHLEVTVEHSRLYYALWGDRGEDGA